MARQILFYNIIVLTIGMILTAVAGCAALVIHINKLFYKTSAVKTAVEWAILDFSQTFGRQTLF